MKSLRFLSTVAVAFLAAVLSSQPLPGAEQESRFAPAAQPTVIRVTGYTPWAWSPPTRARRSALRHFMEQMNDPASGQPWSSLIRIEPDNPLSFPGFSLKILNFLLRAQGRRW